MFDKCFRELCESAAAKEETFGTEFTSNNKFAVFTMFRRIIKLELVFKKKSFGNVNNVLYCRIYPNKITELFYLLPEVFVELDIADFRSTFFSMIENEARLEACFRQLWCIIKEHLPMIEEAAGNGLLPWAREVTDDDYLEHKQLFGTNNPSSREPFVILDYTKGNVYRALLNGNYAKAVRLIEKNAPKGMTLEYQNRLCGYLEEHGAGFLPMPPECNAVRDDDSAEKKEFPVYVGVFITVFLSFSAFFFAAKLIFDLFFKSGTVTVFGAPWYFCFILGALPSLFGAIAFRKPLMKLLFPKRSKALIERDEAKNGKGVNVLADVTFFLAAGFALFVFIMVVFPALRVYEDRLDAASNESIFRRDEYLFSEIDGICHISARYNDYGDRVERPSYVIIMKDGRSLDLDISMSDKQAEEILFPLLKDYSIPMTELDSDRELENIMARP